MLKIFLQSVSYLIAFLVPFLMIHGGESFGFVYYFPLYGVSMLIQLYLSGPILAIVIAGFASVVGLVGFIFTLAQIGTVVPYLFLLEIAWIWFLFWIAQQMMEDRDSKLHRLEEEMEKLELTANTLAQKEKEVEKSCVGIRERISRYMQLESFTDQLASVMQVREIQKLAERAVEKIFEGPVKNSVQLNLFKFPNFPEKDDLVGDWIVRQKIPLIVYDYSQDSRFAHPFYPRRGSLIACPIERDNHVVGVLRLESPVAKAWNDDDLRFLSDIANISSISVTNAIYFEKVESLAVRDSLTGLNVRYRFDERVEEDFSRSKMRGSPLSLLLFDIDHFKKVNDTWGHLVGDKVLRTIAQIILSQTRETDFCARYGGEEIAVIMPLTPVKNSLQIAERVRQKVADTVIGEEKIRVTVSCGLSCVLPDIKNVEELIAATDRALYRAKEAGRNKVVKA